MKMKYGLCALIFLSNASFAQIIKQTKLDASSAWQYCDPKSNPNCVGKSNFATGYHDVVNMPSLDGDSSLFHIDNNNQFGAALWSLPLQQFATATSWKIEYDVNIHDPQGDAVAVEFDANQALGNKNARIIFGTECNLSPRVPGGGGHWRVFQWTGTGTWVDTGIQCSYLDSSQKVISDRWFHVCMMFMRDQQTNNAIFQSLLVKDLQNPASPKVVTQIDFSKLKIPPLMPQPTKYSSTVSSIDVQLDARALGTNYDTYFDGITVTRSDGSQALPSCN